MPKYSRAICSNCLNIINTIDDTHPENKDDFMMVLITNCCNAEPKPIYKEECVILI